LFKFSSFSTSSSFTLFPSSIAANISIALASPIPFIFFNLFIDIFLKFFISFTSFKIVSAIVLLEYFFVPVFNMIAINSTFDIFSTPIFLNLSLGLSFNGKSFIKILFSNYQLLV